MDDLFDDLFTDCDSDGMSDETAFFVTISDKLADNGKQLPIDLTDSQLTDESSMCGLSDEELLAKLNAVLECIKTLEDYEMLISILKDMKDMLTVRILRIFFEALVPVEQRVWATQGMYPPVDKYVDELIDNLLDNYRAFAYGLEQRLIDWTKEMGYFNDPEKKAFLVKRNKIYADYIVLAGEFIGDIT